MLCKTKVVCKLGKKKKKKKKKNYKSNHNENQDVIFSSMKRGIMIFSSKKKRDTKSMVGYDPTTTMERFESERIPSCSWMKIM
jgi:hypothetical protein